MRQHKAVFGEVYSFQENTRVKILLTLSLSRLINNQHEKDILSYNFCFLVLSPSKYVYLNVLTVIFVLKVNCLVSCYCPFKF